MSLLENLEQMFLSIKKMKHKYKKDIVILSNIYITIGENLIKKDLFNSAIDVINEGIAIFGPTIDSYQLLLQSYLLLRQKEKILEIINKIKQVNASDYKTWHYLGKSYSDLDEMSKAIEAFEFAELMGHCGQANYLNLIIAYQSSKYFMKALVKTKEYLRLFPQHYTANVLATIIMFLYEKMEKRLAYANVALEIVPKMNSL